MTKSDDNIRKSWNKTNDNREGTENVRNYHCEELISEKRDPRIFAGFAVSRIRTRNNREYYSYLLRDTLALLISRRLLWLSPREINHSGVYALAYNSISGYMCDVSLRVKYSTQKHKRTWLIHETKVSVSRARAYRFKNCE